MTKVNPYYAGTEEWHAFESGVADVTRRIANGYACDPDVNEDHLVMLGQAYIAGVRWMRAGQRQSGDVE